MNVSELTRVARILAQKRTAAKIKMQIEIDGSDLSPEDLDELVQCGVDRMTFSHAYLKGLLEKKP